MLDDFSLEQQIIYRTLINSVKNNKTSHAYLIETNGYSKSFDLAKAFSKYLLCPKGYSNNKKCANCHQCENIDKNEFIELKIIEPEGQWIKKSQLEDLQEMFSKKSIIGNKKIYIINKADKLNISSSNSILKFLEEPEDGVIAILIAENIFQLLPTIVSRCQILSLKNQASLTGLSTLEKIGHFLKDNNSDIIDYTSSTDSKEKISVIVEFIKYYEENHTNTLLYINKLWHDHFQERDSIYDAFTIMMLFYKDVLYMKLNKKIEVFNDYVNNVKEVEKKNNLNEITYKINVIMNLREKIKFNINNNMLMDKLIIELEGCE